jgi:magnesium chelatase family protein
VARIDIHVEVKRVPFQELSGLESGEPSASIRQRVEAARHSQEQRFARLNKPNVLVNADMGPAEVQQFCRLDETTHNLLWTAMQQMNLSARAYHRVLKLARTIADLANSDRIQVQHLAEAIQYRARNEV